MLSISQYASANAQSASPPIMNKPMSPIANKPLPPMSIINLLNSCKDNYEHIVSHFDIANYGDSTTKSLYSYIENDIGEIYQLAPPNSPLFLEDADKENQVRARQEKARMAFFNKKTVTMCVNNSTSPHTVLNLIID